MELSPCYALTHVERWEGMAVKFHCMVLSPCYHGGRREQTSSIATLPQHDNYSWDLRIKGFTNLWNQREVVEPLKGKAYKDKVSPLECPPLKGYWDHQPPTHVIFLPLLAIIGRKGPFYQPLAPWYTLLLWVKAEKIVCEVRPLRLGA